MKKLFIFIIIGFSFSFCKKENQYIHKVFNPGITVYKNDSAYIDIDNDKVNDLVFLTKYSKYDYNGNLVEAYHKVLKTTDNRFLITYSEDPQSNYRMLEKGDNIPDTKFLYWINYIFIHGINLTYTSGIWSNQKESGYIGIKKCELNDCSYGANFGWLIFSKTDTSITLRELFYNPVIYESVKVGETD